MATRRPSRVSWVLLVAVVAAFAVGAAASILVGAATAPAPSSGPVSLIYLPPWLLTVADFGFLAFFGISFIVMRLQSGSKFGSGQFAVRVLIVVLLAIIFLLVAHAFSGTGVVSTNSSSQNATGTPPPSTGGSHYINGTGGVDVWPGLPPWLPFVVLAGVALLVVVIVAPGVRGYLEERGGGKSKAPASTDIAKVRSALARAVKDLDEGHDPRDVILGLYAVMLARLQPMAVGIDVSTPEEIRAVQLERLGVRPGPARMLTRLFEEARYSQHPMGSESSQAAQDAVREVLADLDRRESPS